MARIRDFTVTEFSSTAATYVPTRMPVHQAGDLLVAIWGKDSTTGLAPTGTTGGGTGTWTEYEDVSSTAANGGIHVCRATASDAQYSGTLTTETGVLVVISIADVYGSTLADCILLSEVAAADATAIPFAGANGFSTTQTDMLILDMFFSDGGTSPTAYAPSTNLYAGDVTNGSLCVAYRYIKAASTIPQVNFFGRGNDDGRFMMLAIRPATAADRKSAYSDPAISVGQVIRPEVGVSTMQSDTWPTALTTFAVGSDWEAVFLDNAGAFTNVTAAANSVTAADVAPVDTVGNAIYLGHSSTFIALCGTLSTAGAGGTYALEYWNGSAWVTLTQTNGTTAVLTSANIHMCWKVPTNWAQTAVNGTTKYWVRLRCTATHTADPVISFLRRDGQLLTYVVSTASADNGTNPYTDGASNAGANNLNALAGHQHNYGAALNLSSGILYTTYRGALGRDLGVDIAEMNTSGKSGGVHLTLFDSSNNNASYILGARGAKSMNVDGRNIAAIDWNGAATAWAATGSVNKAAVTYSHWGTLGRYGAAAVVYSMFSLVTRIGIAGGSAASPLSLAEVVYTANNSIGLFPFLVQNGSAVDVWVPLQFGGGDTSAVDCSGTVFQYPARYDGVNYFAWNAGDNVAGMKFYAKTNDYFNFKGTQWLCPNKARWEWDASSVSSGWTGDFSNCLLKGQTVTLRAAFDVANSDNMTFDTCTVATNGASLDNCTFLGSTVSLASLAHAALLTNCSFTSAGTGHALEIAGAADTITLNGNNFNGYAGSNGSTGNEAIYVNIASGTVTINISSGSTPSIRTAGATVNVVSGATVTFTGLPTGCDIVILTAGTSTILAQVDSHGSTSYAWGYSGTPTIDIGFIKPGYIPYYIRGLALGTTDSSIPVSLTADRNYS